MKKYYFLATALLLCCLVGCDKDPVEQVEATGIKATADTVRVAYGGTVDLSALFSIDPAGASGSLTYSISRQPEYVEGNDAEYTEVEAYSVSGNTLASADVRVPDAFVRSDALRTVREGKLKITLEGSSEAESVEVVIVQTDKPALTPVITLSENENYTYTDGPDGKLLTLQTVGVPNVFPATWFKIAPVDFDPSDIRVGTGRVGNYITEFAGIPRAGGFGGATGTGGFIVAFYKDNTLEEVLADENLPQARLYVNVEYVEPDAVVGIVANTENPPAFRHGNTSTKSTSGFVRIKLANGEEKPVGDFSSTHSFTWVSGYYSQTQPGTNDVYTVGSGKFYPDEDAESLWREGNLKLNNPDLPAGTEVRFKVSLAKTVTGGVTTEPLGEAAWTVDVTSTITE